MTCVKYETVCSKVKFVWTSMVKKVSLESQFLKCGISPEKSRIENYIIAKNQQVSYKRILTVLYFGCCVLILVTPHFM